MRTPPVTPTASPAHSRAPAPQAMTAWMSTQWLPHGWLGGLHDAPPTAENRTAGRLQFCGQAMSWTTTASSPRGLTATVGSLPAPTSDSRTAAGRTGGVGLGVGVGMGVSVANGVVAEGRGVDVAGGVGDGSTLGAVEPGGPAVTVGAGDISEPQADTRRRVTKDNVAARPVRTTYSHSETHHMVRTGLARIESRGRTAAPYMTFDPVSDRVSWRMLLGVRSRRCA